VLRLNARALLVLACVAAPASASAQQAAYASDLLPPGHWVQEAALRLYALGAAPHGFDPGAGTLSKREAVALLRHAGEHDAAGGLARAYLARLLEEFPETGGRGSRAPAPLGVDAALSGLVRDSAGLAWPGAGYDSLLHGWTGAPAAEDGSLLQARFGFATTLHRRVALAGDARIGGGRVDVADLHAALLAGPVALWAGRRPIRYGTHLGGPVALGGPVPYDGGGFHLPEPLTLPSILRYIGPIRLESFLARVDQAAPVDRPWFWGARVHVAPHPRLALAFNRAAMFGRHDGSPITFANILHILFGIHSGGSEFENQIASVELRVRPPIPRLPALVYIEWGLEDSAGAWYKVPGILAGVELPALPGLPSASAGIEHTFFRPSCCGNPIWYRHWFFTEGWTQSGLPLGHPLGGHGAETRGRLRWETPSARLALETQLFRRERRFENLFHPDRGGVSHGGEVRLRFRPLHAIETLGRLELERGDWGGSHRLVVQATAFLGR
jgi:hypothetical protein